MRLTLFSYDYPHNIPPAHAVHLYLLETFNDWTSSLNNDPSVMAGYVDFIWSDMIRSDPIRSDPILSHQ